MPPKLNTSELNTVKLNNGGAPTPGFETFMRRLRGNKPIVKIEFIEVGGAVTDITNYYLSGANFEQIKERAPDEIQAGNFDITLSNHDNYFSEFVAGSLLDGIQYHGAKIRVSLGFIFDDGSTLYEVIGVGLIDQLKAKDTKSTVTFRCRDLISKILDKTLRPTPASEVPIYGANRGNGTISIIETKPFATVAEDWVIACTTGGDDGVAKFSVTGSVSGSIGPATSGEEFINNANGVKFTLLAGNEDWAVGDEITFSTAPVPQWDFENQGKIIWSVLTGYNWDTDTQEAWSDSVLALDHTKSSANTEIDYDSFVAAIADFGGSGAGSDLKGFIAYETAAKDFFESLLILFLGSVYTDQNGRIVLRTFVPQFGGTNIRTFKDERKITALGYVRSIDEVINSVVVQFKKADAWEFSGFGTIFDSTFIEESSASIGKYGAFTLEVQSAWHSATGSHVEDFAQKLIGRFSEPPLNVDFKTGLDALRSQIGDNIEITDEKYGFVSLPGEISKIEKVMDEEPKEVVIRLRRDEDVALRWGFLGSSVDEGDGLSPQTTLWADANDQDKRFCYSWWFDPSDIDYRMF